MFDPDLKLLNLKFAITTSMYPVKTKQIYFTFRVNAKFLEQIYN